MKKGKRKVEQKGGKNSLLPASLACLLFSFSASVLARSHLFCFIRTHSFFVVFDLSLPLSLSPPPPFIPGQDELLLFRSRQGGKARDRHPSIERNKRRQRIVTDSTYCLSLPSFSCSL